MVPLVFDCCPPLISRVPTFVDYFGRLIVRNRKKIISAFYHYKSKVTVFNLLEKNYCYDEYLEKEILHKKTARKLPWVEQDFAK